jgi:hypothetical protein
MSTRWAMCGRLLGKENLHFAALVGAAMRYTGPLAIMPSADEVPVKSTHSKMLWPMWVVQRCSIRVHRDVNDSRKREIVGWPKFLQRRIISSQAQSIVYKRKIFLPIFVRLTLSIAQANLPNCNFAGGGVAVTSTGTATGTTDSGGANHTHVLLPRPAE